MSPDTIQPTPWGQSEIRGPVHRFREALLLRCFTPMLREGAHVLDAGCGSGSLSMALQKLGCKVQALERSVAFVEKVRHHLARYGTESRVTVQQGSVTHLPFGDAVFDGAVCAEVLEHLRPEDGGDGAALAQLHRVLKAEAWLALSVPLNPGLWDEADVWAGHVKRYRRAELVALVSGAGFSVAAARSWGFPLGRVYHRLLFGPWLRHTAHLDAGQREARADTRAAGNPLLVGGAAALLRFDELFSRYELGRGIVVIARKR